MAQKLNTKKHVIRVGGKLNEVVTLSDEAGNVMHKMVKPLMVEFYARDLIQVIVGASILAIPIAFTEETWKLGATLPLNNVLGIALMSLVFISTFVYYNFYRREHLAEHWMSFVQRVVTIYAISLLVVSLILTLIQQAPWALDRMLAVKRVILVAFPASMSAAVADMIK